MQLKSPEKLKAYLLIQDLSARGLAEGAGLGSHTYVAKLLSGKATTAKPETAARLCLFLGVGLDDLWVPKSSTEARHAVDHMATLRVAPKPSRKKGVAA